MKYDAIKNPNYVATVIRVAALEDLEGLDNLKGLRVFGMQALVSKDVAVGDVGVLFSTEVQLSQGFAAANNLHRHSNLNMDPTKTGYLEDSRRVKAIKLRGYRSDSLFMPLTAFAYLWPNGVTDAGLEKFFEVGDVFDSINGHEILRKYQIKEPGINKGPQARIRRVDLKVFPEHIDSENYWRNAHKIPEDAPVVVTQKIHGTSVRYGTVPVAREKGYWERLLNKLGFPTVDTEYRFVVGSRKVVKSIDGEAESAGKQHFYADDLWSVYADTHGLAEVIPPGYLVYGELVGWTPDGAPIQPNYTYDQEQGTSKLYVYRVATVTPTGVVTDLSWPATKAFARGIGLATVPEVATNVHHKFVDSLDAQNGVLIDANFYNDWSDNDQYFVDPPVRLSDATSVDEGVCIRYDGPNGIYILKAKSPIFLGHESALLDTGEADIESEESE